MGFSSRMLDPEQNGGGRKRKGRDFKAWLGKVVRLQSESLKGKGGKGEGANAGAGGDSVHAEGDFYTRRVQIAQRRYSTHSGSEPPDGP